MAPCVLLSTSNTAGDLCSWWLWDNTDGRLAILTSGKFLQDGPAYVRLFVTILRDIFKEETVEYVLALVDEMLSGKWDTEQTCFVKNKCI